MGRPGHRSSVPPLLWLYALALLIVAWGGVDADLPFAAVRDPIGSITTTSKYQDRFMGAWTTSLDTSALMEMFQVCERAPGACQQ
jgi:hypothetical protein